ncbi:histidine kinase [uncultured Agrococcus sp.]|uniref:sensor histidine kinase n=1 Tax=uncultured Agrococcus sp. TaxID=382258 RepID=UPI0025FD013A|nr:histidine kinase [uncultured Agrococcus sp.]
MWDFTALPAAARFSLLAVAVVALVATALIEFFTEEGSPTALLEVATLAAAALFAWRPPIASLVLLVVATTALAVREGATFVLALALISGLVVYTCRAWLIALYGATTLMFAVVVETFGQQMAAGGTVGTIAIALASSTVGFAFRRNRKRVIGLKADLERVAHEADQVVKGERDRIADELHNIIAHDLTIVVMHTRALRLTQETDERKQSEQAIMTSATQAMTDIRRMLRIVNDDWDSDSAVPTETLPLLDRLPILRQELETSGIAVQMSIPDELPISSSVEATLRHIASESVTNILKHTPGSTEVRIDLFVTDTSVTLRVWNALGSDKNVPELNSGFGLRRMNQRVELLGGTFATGPREGGWELEAVLPRI